MKVRKGGRLNVRVPVASKAEVKLGPPPKRNRKKYPFVATIKFQSLKIDVENRRGDTRKGTDGDGHQWSVQMKHHYGEIRETEGVDGDKLDVYVGPLADSPLVVVVHQNDPVTNKYDEDKVMLGFANKRDAVAAYKSQYDRPGFYGGATSMPIGEFGEWVADRRKRGSKVMAKARIPRRIRKAGPVGVNTDTLGSLPSTGVTNELHMYWALNKAQRKEFDAWLREEIGRHRQASKGGLFRSSDGRLLLKAKRGERVSGARYLARFQTGVKPSGAPVYKYVYSYAQLLAHLKDVKNLKEGAVIDLQGGKGKHHIQIHGKTKDGLLSVTDHSTGEHAEIAAEELHSIVREGISGKVREYVAKKRKIVEATEQSIAAGRATPAMLARNMAFYEQLFNMASGLFGEDWGTMYTGVMSGAAKPSDAEGGEGGKKKRPGRVENLSREGTLGNLIPGGKTGTGGYRKVDYEWEPPSGEATLLHNDIIPAYDQRFFPDKDGLIFKDADGNVTGNAYVHQAQGVAHARQSFEERDGFLIMDTAGQGKTLTALITAQQHLKAEGKADSGRVLWVTATSGHLALKTQLKNDASTVGIDMQTDVTGDPGYYVKAYHELYIKRVKLDPFTEDPGFTADMLAKLANVSNKEEDIRIKRRADLIHGWFKEDPRHLMTKQTALEIATGLDDYADVRPELKGFDMIVFDESHHMKNPAGLRSQAGVQLQQQEMGPNGGGCKMLYMSATPFTTLRDCHYLRGMGWFRSGEEFAKWAEGRGASLKRRSGFAGDLPFDVENPKTPIPTVQVSAEVAMKGAGIKRIPKPGKDDNKLRTSFRKVSVQNPEHEAMFQKGAMCAQIAQKALGDNMAFTIGGMMTGWRKQAWELAKADHVIANAKKDIDAGKQVLVMSEFTRHDHAALGGVEPDPKDPKNKYGAGLAAMLRKRAAESKDRFEHDNLMAAAKQIDGIVRSMHSENVLDRISKELAQHVMKRDGKKGDWQDHVAQVHGQARAADGKMIGRGTHDQTDKEQSAYQRGEKQVAVGTMAKAGTGLSWHDDPKYGSGRPRSQHNMSNPWHAVGFDQVSGRSHRLGSQSDTEQKFYHGDDASEKNVATVIARKLASMGALVEGNPGAKVPASLLANFESGHSMSAEEQAKIMHIINSGGDLPPSLQGEAREIVEGVLAMAEEAKRHFAMVVDDVEHGGSNAVLTVARAIRGSGDEAKDEENRVAAGQMVAEFGCRISQDKRAPMRFRVQQGNIPDKVWKKMGASQGTRKYPDGSLSVGNPATFFTTAEKHMTAKTVKLQAGSKKLYSKVAGKMFAVPNWSSGALDEHYEKWGNGGKGGHVTHDNKVVEKKYPKEFEAAKKEFKAAKRGRERDEQTYREVLGDDEYRKIRKLDKNPNQRGAAKKTAKKVKKVKKSGWVVKAYGDRAPMDKPRASKHVEKSEGRALLPRFIPFGVDDVNRFVIEKGKKAQIGEVRMWADGEHRKVKEGTWVNVATGKTKKVKEPGEDKPVRTQRASRRNSASDPPARSRKTAPKATRSKKKAKSSSAKKPKLPAIVPHPKVPKELLGTKPTLAQIEEMTGEEGVRALKKVFGSLEPNKYPPPKRLDTLTIDLTGDLDSKPIMRWGPKGTSKEARSAQQRAYTGEFVRRNEHVKWERARKLLGDNTDLEAREAFHDMMLDESLPQNKRDVAAGLLMMAVTGLRSGTIESWKSEGRVGCGYIRKDHVEVNGDVVSLNFEGKAGVENTAEVADPDLADYLRDRMKSARKRDGFVLDYDRSRADTVRKDATNGLGSSEFKTKDLRMCAASRMAADKLAEQSKGLKLPADPDEQIAMLRDIYFDVSESCAKLLNHKKTKTVKGEKVEIYDPATTRKSYIAPCVLQGWARNLGAAEAVISEFGEVQKAGEEVTAESILGDAVGLSLGYGQHDGEIEEPEDAEGWESEDEPDEFQMFSMPAVFWPEGDPEEPEYDEDDGPIEEMEKGLVRIALLFKGAVPDGGNWQPIPGGKHGGYRRKHGAGWEYWYPTADHARRAGDHHAKQGEKMRKKLGRYLRSRGAKQEQIAKFLDEYEHHTGQGEAAGSHARHADIAAGKFTTKDERAAAAEKEGSEGAHPSDRLADQLRGRGLSADAIKEILSHVEGVQAKQGETAEEKPTASVEQEGGSGKNEPEPQEGETAPQKDDAGAGEAEPRPQTRAGHERKIEAPQAAEGEAPPIQGKKRARKTKPKHEKVHEEVTENVAEDKGPPTRTLDKRERRRMVGWLHEAYESEKGTGLKRIMAPKFDQIIERVLHLQHAFGLSDQETDKRLQSLKKRLKRGGQMVEGALSEAFREGNEEEYDRLHPPHDMAEVTAKVKEATKR